jgi:hypothetical protein
VVIGKQNPYGRHLASLLLSFFLHARVLWLRPARGPEAGTVIEAGIQGILASFRHGKKPFSAQAGPTYS